MVAGGAQRDRPEPVTVATEQLAEGSSASRHVGGEQGPVVELGQRAGVLAVAPHRVAHPSTRISETSPRKPSPTSGSEVNQTVR